MAFVQIWIMAVAVSFCWAALGMIESEVERWEHAVDHNDATTLRWTGSFRSYIDRSGAELMPTLPPRSDHQRGADPLVCEIAHDLGIDPENATWSCP